MKKVSKVLAIVLLIFLPTVSFAQLSKWKRKIRYRNDFIIGLGVSNFLGDLGGADQIGTYGLKDLEGAFFRPTLQMGLRYRLTPYFCVKGSLFQGTLKGDDKRTLEPFRNNRQLNFKSPITEFSVQAEVFAIKEKYGRRYRIRGMKGIKNMDAQLYGFVGVGAFFFNPKGQYLNGKWYELQPLGTEGQGMLEGKKKYSRISLAVPFGIGFKYGFQRFWSFGMEFGLRKTITDYIDDVSTTYVSDTIAAYYGANSLNAFFADPSQAQGIYPTSVRDGEQRGNPDKKDSYMFITITMNYKFTIRKKRTRSKF